MASTDMSAKADHHGKPDRTTAAIRSLEFGLHPNTSETEAIAAIHAFRKVTGGQTLENMCRSRWDKRTSDGMTLVEYRQDWADRFNSQQERTTELVGEVAALRAQLRAAHESQVAAEGDAKNLRAQLGRNLPAIRDPDMPIAPPLDKTPLYPLGHTDLLFVSIGDTELVEPTWNGARLQMVTALLSAGVPMEKLNECVKGIVPGERKGDGYRYYPDAGISIKNQNTSEIFRDIMRTAVSFHEGRFRVQVRSSDKPRRTTGKAGGKHSRGTSFPGCVLTLEPAAETAAS